MTTTDVAAATRATPRLPAAPTDVQERRSESFVERYPRPAAVAAGSLLGIAAAVGGAVLLGRATGRFSVHPALRMAGALSGAIGATVGAQFALVTAFSRRVQPPAAGGGDEPAAKPAPDQSIPATVTGISDPEAPRGTGPSFALEEVAGGFSQPVQVTRAPGDEALYVVEKTGAIQRLDGNRRSTLLDISGLVSRGGEQGLLSVAFHPQYASNGRLFVNYTDLAGDTHVTEYRRGRNGEVDPASARDLLVVDQPYSNHNGGQLMFGPDDMLYIGMGDGGAGGDPENRAQDLRSPLGKLLRINVDRPAGDKPYAVPADNPYADAPGGARPEIWASGLRNPWRFSFDARSGDLWLGDVGQGKWEEVNYLPAGTAGGVNFGWDVREGANPYEQKPAGPGRIADPVLQYSHDEGSSITGGFVYRGTQVPSLQGHYVYADIADDTIRTLRLLDGRVAERHATPVGQRMIVSFGEGPDGEMYVASIDGGIHKIVARGEQRPAPVEPPGTDIGTPARAVAFGTVPGEFRFDQQEIRVPAGRITLVLRNNDRGHHHNVHVRGNGVDEVGEVVRSGKESTVTLDLKPGRYEFVCTPHQYAGMKGTLIVE